MIIANNKVKISDRVERIKKGIYSKAYTGGEYHEGVKACMERARYLTESWAVTEGQPAAIRRANALENILANLAIFIKEGEVVVGYNASSPNRVSAWPEFALNALEEALDGRTRKYVDDRDVEDLERIVKYWQGKTLRDYVEQDVFFRMDEGREMLRIARANCNVSSTAWMSDMLVAAPDYEFALKHGLNGVIKIIKERVERERRDMPDTGPGFFKSLDKLQEWEAMIIACSAVIRWAERYAELARFMAKQEEDAGRRRELEKIAEVCSRVPANPPQHFQESLQSYWFLWLVTHMIEQSGEGAPLRMDQAHWPCYERDVIRDKALSREEAVELLALLRLKFAEMGRLGTWVLRESFQGAATMSSWTIGGVKADGSSAFNELTETVIMSALVAPTPQPNVIIRYKPPIPERVKELALESIRKGSGYPSFINDDSHVESLCDYGIPLEDARSWVVEGCCVSHCASSNGLGLKTNPSWALLPAKCLELALNNGVEIYPGSGVRLGDMAVGAEVARLGPATGEAEKFNSYEDVREAFRQQVKFGLKLGQRMRDMARHYNSRLLPNPFLSSMYPTTIEEGADAAGWEAIPQTGMVCAGMVDTADALAGIKKVVFHDKKYTMGQLLLALKANWEGYGEMRQDFLNAPKWGNDDDFADEVAKKDVFDMMAAEFSQVKDYWGKTPKLTPQSVVIFWSQGKKTGALPNGRRDGDFLADAGTSPVYGMDIKGPTAVLKSCSNLDYSLFKGSLLNQRLSPVSVAGEKGFKLFYDYISTWYDLGVDHVQFNVVDTKTLRDAQKEPEKYADLLVRVAGYSAYFTQLNKDTQDSVMARTEQALA